MIPNKLERALERAAKEPASRPEFYRVLLESEVFILGDSGACPGGRCSRWACWGAGPVRWSHSRCSGTRRRRQRSGSRSG